MFKHDELEVIPKEITDIFKSLELKVLEDIVRRIKQTGEITSSADYQLNKLYELGVSKKNINEYLKNALDITDEKLNDLYSKVIKTGYVRDKKLYDALGKDFIPFEENYSLQALIKSVSDTTKNEVLNITKTLGFVIDDGSKSIELSDYYIKKLNEAYFQIQTGTFDYNTTLKNTVDEMLKSGLRHIDYYSGSHNRIDVAVRRSVMTGLNIITNKICDDNMRELETEYAEVSFHLTARPTHQLWQGRVWSKDELISVCGLGEATGLLGINCYHHYDAFIPNVSIRQYSDEFLEEQIKEMNRKIKYGNKEYTKYEAIQKQRQLERNLRAYKEKIHLLKLGKADNDTLLNIKTKYIKTLSFYKDFSKRMGLRMQMERVHIVEFK